MAGPSLTYHSWSVSVALDLYEILKQRVEKALDESKVEEGALRRIAAYASREMGDARKAVELLVKAAKVAEDTTGRLTQKEVEVAADTLQVDKTEELIRALATQQKLSLIACYASLAWVRPSRARARCMPSTVSCAKLNRSSRLRRDAYRT